MLKLEYGREIRLTSGRNKLLARTSFKIEMRNVANDVGLHLYCRDHCRLGVDLLLLEGGLLLEYSTVWKVFYKPGT